MLPKTQKAAAVGRLIGYARVSTEEQGTDPQRDELQAAGCAMILEEHASGLASLKWKAAGSLGGLSFERSRADEVQRRAAPNGIVEAVDVMTDSACGLGSGKEDRL